MAIGVGFANRNLRSRVTARIAIVAGIALSGLAGAASSVLAADAPPLKNLAEFPAVRLAAKVQGTQALRSLSAGQLAGIAARYRMSAERLAEVLRNDSTAWLDESGHLFFVDTLSSRDAASASASNSRMATQVAAASLDLRQTFSLHSLAGSNRVIYLDFDGQSLSGTAWGAISDPYDAPPYDLDGNPGAFSDTEKTRIQHIWQRVAEDFSPFDIDVTTEDPGADAINSAGLSDQTFGTRVLITRYVQGLCGSLCGGVAFVGVFGRPDGNLPEYYQPAWVFYDVLGGGDENFVAETVSHEAGHNLGLVHDGTRAGLEYYTGHNWRQGIGPSGWAPIMGNSQGRLVTQWSRGEYPDANNTEDDLAVIASYGAPLRADDHGNGRSTATALGGTRSGNAMSVKQTGVISERTDVDYFRFDMRGGLLSLRASPDGVSPNLDILLSVYDSAGNRVAVSADANTGREVLNASLSANLPAGRYFVAIDGVGDTDPSPGYSDYASLGQYSISGSYPAAADGDPPSAVISATLTAGNAPLTVQFDGSGSSDTDGSIAAYAWEFGDGATSSQISPRHNYVAAGDYTAQLTVTDNSGRQGQASLPISVSAAGKKAFVSKIALSVNRSPDGYQCTAKVTIKSSTGVLVGGAKVTGRWTGVNTSSRSQGTDSKGVAGLKNARTGKTGTCAFSVTDVSKSGFTYDAARNAETSHSLRY